MEHKTRNPTKCADGLPDVCDYLVHYHTQHTTDAVSQLTSPDFEVEIYIVSDPACRQRFHELYLQLLPTSDQLQ